MALALFADDDYEEVAARLTQTLGSWGCWEREWQVPTSGGITQARQRLGPEPLAEVFSQVAEPVAGLDTIGAFLGGLAADVGGRDGMGRPGHGGFFARECNPRLR